MSAKIDRFSNQKLLNGIISWGARLLFFIAIVVLSVLSFVDSFELSPDIKKITTLALVSAVLNYLVWDSFYTQQFEKQLNFDLLNNDYCIHKRYYNARKGWKYIELQNKIRQYNDDFKNAWLTDVEDITGRSIEEIKNGGYRKQSHKTLIWRIKHHRYPKTGIKTPNDVLYILSVGKSDSMKIRTKAEEHYHSFGRVRKALGVMIGCFLIASFAYDFISDGYKSAIITLVLNVAILFTSLFFGAISGVKGGKLKLSTAEIVSEKLEEWKDKKPTEEPYKEIEKVEEVDKMEKVHRTTLEIK